MGCQKKIAKEIIEADADYVLALKGNQEQVHEEVKSFLDSTEEQQKQKRPKGALVPKELRALKGYEMIEKDHGRIETRRYYQSDYLDWFADKAKWEGLRSVGMVESTREVNGKSSLERRYYLSSLALDVENFCFREDQSRARQGYAAENLAMLR